MPCDLDTGKTANKGSRSIIREECNGCCLGNGVTVGGSSYAPNGALPWEVVQRSTASGLRSRPPNVRMWGKPTTPCHRSHVEGQRMSWSRSRASLVPYSRFIVDKDFYTLRILSRLEYSSASRKTQVQAPVYHATNVRRYNCPKILSVVQNKTALLILRKCFTSPALPTTYPKTHSKPV